MVHLLLRVTFYDIHVWEYSFPSKFSDLECYFALKLSVYAQNEACQLISHVDFSSG